MNASIDSIYFTDGSSQINDFFVANPANAPIGIYAVATKGTGFTNSVVAGVQYTWQAAFAPAGTTYVKGTSPNGASTCGTPPQTPAVASILQQGAGGQAYGPSGSPIFGSAYTQLADRNNPLPAAPNYTARPPLYTTQTDHVFFAPPLALDSSGAETSTTVSGSYCITMIATAVNSGVQGKVNIVVSNAP